MVNLKIKPVPYLHVVQFYETDCWANLDETFFIEHNLISVDEKGLH